MAGCGKPARPPALQIRPLAVRTNLIIIAGANAVQASSAACTKVVGEDFLRINAADCLKALAIGERPFPLERAVLVQRL